MLLNKAKYAWIELDDYRTITLLKPVLMIWDKVCSKYARLQPVSEILLRPKKTCGVKDRTIIIIWISLRHLTGSTINT